MEIFSKMSVTRVPDAHLLADLVTANVITPAQAELVEGSWAMPPVWREKCCVLVQSFPQKMTQGQAGDIRTAAHIRWYAAATRLRGALAAAKSAAAAFLAATTTNREASQVAQKAAVRLERLRRRAAARGDASRCAEIDTELRQIRAEQNIRDRADVAARVVVDAAQGSARSAYAEAVDAYAGYAAAYAAGAA